MAASIAFSDRTFDGTPAPQPAASLVATLDSPETRAAGTPCGSACFSLELLDHTPPAAIVDSENPTPASPVHRQHGCSPVSADGATSVPPVRADGFQHEFETSSMDGAIACLSRQNPQLATHDCHNDGDTDDVPVPMRPSCDEASFASFMASVADDAPRTTVTLAVIHVPHHDLTCIVPPHLVAAVLVPGACGEVLRFGDFEPATSIVGEITDVWAAGSDAAAQGHVVRVLPARDGAAMRTEQQRRNNAAGLARARNALSQIATMTPALRGIRILSVEFAVGSQHAVCVACGRRPGPAQSRRLATRLGTVLHTALRLIWVDEDGNGQARET